jgi:hypothetical protein
MGNWFCYEEKGYNAETEARLAAVAAKEARQAKAEQFEQAKGQGGGGGGRSSNFSFNFNQTRAGNGLSAFPRDVTAGNAESPPRKREGRSPEERGRIAAAQAKYQVGLTVLLEYFCFNPPACLPNQPPTNQPTNQPSHRPSTQRYRDRIKPPPSKRRRRRAKPAPSYTPSGVFLQDTKTDQVESRQRAAREPLERRTR